jgi:integrase
MSPRPRLSDRDLPACMYLKHGAYWLVKRGRWYRLGKDKRAALIAYAKRTQPVVGAMPKLIDEAMLEIENGLKPSTVKQYRTVADQLKAMLVEFEPDQVTSADIYAIRRAYLKRPNMGNRALSVLTQVFKYALQNGRCQNNPCIGVDRHKETKRTRLVAWPEFHAIRAHGSARLQCVMDLLVTTGQRPGDVLKIRRADMTEDGIAFRQAKTDAKVTVPWNPDMRAAVERAKALHGSTGSLTLFRTRYGSTPAYKTVYDEWCRACKAAGIADTDLRDLRALAGTEAKRQGKNATKLLGHRSETMTARYLRDKEITVAEGPVIRRLIDTDGK